MGFIPDLLSLIPSNANQSHKMWGKQVAQPSGLEVVLYQSALNAGWVLLPLVPAVLIYLIFPKTQTRLAGPFQGLTVRATGAFAAYFIVFLAIYPIINDQNRNIRTLLRPTWKVTGQVIVQDEEGREVRFDNDVAVKPEVTLRPDIVTMTNPTTFQVIVPEIDNQVPSINVRYPGWGAAWADPENPSEGQMIRRDDAQRTITISSPMVIRKRACQGLGGPTAC